MEERLKEQIEFEYEKYITAMLAINSKEEILLKAKEIMLKKAIYDFLTLEEGIKKMTEEECRFLLMSGISVIDRIYLYIEVSHFNPILPETIAKKLNYIVSQN